MHEQTQAALVHSAEEMAAVFMPIPEQQIGMPKVYAHEHANGKMYQGTAEQVSIECPVFIGLPLASVSMAMELATLGQQIMAKSPAEQQQRPKPVIERTDAFAALKHESVPKSAPSVEPVPLIPPHAVSEAPTQIVTPVLVEQHTDIPRVIPEVVAEATMPRPEEIIPTETSPPVQAIEQPMQPMIERSLPEPEQQPELPHDAELSLLALPAAAYELSQETDVLPPVAGELPVPVYSPPQTEVTFSEVSLTEGVDEIYTSLASQHPESDLGLELEREVQPPLIESFGDILTAPIPETAQPFEADDLGVLPPITEKPSFATILSEATPTPEYTPMPVPPILIEIAAKLQAIPEAERPEVELRIIAIAEATQAIQKLPPQAPPAIREQLIEKLEQQCIEFLVLLGIAPSPITVRALQVRMSVPAVGEQLRRATLVDIGDTAGTHERKHGWLGYSLPDFAEPHDFLHACVGNSALAVYARQVRLHQV